MLDRFRRMFYNHACQNNNALTGNSRQYVLLQRAAVAESAALSKLTELALERFC